MGNKALQLRKHIELLDKIIANKEEMIEGITSAIEKYMEGVDMSEAMLDMVDAEISLKGKASRRTVYGLIGGRWVSQRNKGLTSYLYQKIVATKKVMDLIAKYRYESNIEEKELETIDRVDESLENVNGRLKKRIGRFVNAVRSTSVKSVEEEKRALKLTGTELRILNHILRYEIIEYHLARRLTMFFFAPHAERRLVKYISREQRFFKKFLREEIKITIDEMKDLKFIFGLIKEGNRLLKILHTKRVKGKKVIVGGIYEFKTIKKSLRRARNIQRKLRKIKEYGAKYGIKLSKAIIKTSGEINEAERMLSYEVTELGELTTEFQQLISLIDIVKKFETGILNTELTLNPKILWMNEIISRNIKYLKKGKEDAERLINSLSTIAEKTILPIIESRANERNRFAEYILSEEMIIKKLKMK